MNPMKLSLIGHEVLKRTKGANFDELAAKMNVNAKTFRKICYGELALTRSVCLALVAEVGGKKTVWNRLDNEYWGGI